MDLVASRPLPLHRSRGWWSVLSDGALVALFVALACSISASQALLAALCALALARPAAVPAIPGAGLRDLAARVWRQPMAPPFAVFAALTLLSASFSGNPGWSFWIARDLLRIGAFYVVLHYTRGASHALRLWYVFLLTLTLMAAYGLGQAYLCTVRPDVLGSWIQDVCTHRERVRGPFSIYMTFGGVLLLGALFVLACLANLPWRRAWRLVPTGTLTITAMALTYSRNAWLGLAAGTLGLVVTARRALRLVAILAAVLALALLATPDAVTDRVRSFVDTQDATARDRVAMWRAGLSMIADWPILGVGPGEVRAWYQHYRRPEAVRPSTGHLHNSPIQIAAERGLPALAAWIWIWVAFFRQGWRVLRPLGREPSASRALVCASLGCVAGFLVAGLFEHNFGDGEVVMVVYALMALPWIVERDRAAAAADAGSVGAPTAVASR